MKTVSLADGKYAYDIDDGQMVAARRHGVDWPAGYADRHHNALVAAIVRVAELEDEVGAHKAHALVAKLRAPLRLDATHGEPEARADRAKLAHEEGIIGSAESDARVHVRGGNLVVLLDDGFADVVSWGRSRELAEQIMPRPEEERGTVVNSAEALLGALGTIVERGMLRGVLGFDDDGTVNGVRLVALVLNDERQTRIRLAIATAPDATANAGAPCQCANIMIADPLRHFRECERRAEPETEHASLESGEVTSEANGYLQEDVYSIAGEDG